MLDNMGTLKQTSRLARASRSMRLAALLACACLAGLAIWTHINYATTAVALYVKDFAVVAVDGRVNKIGPLISGHKAECKLYVADGKVAVLAGLTEEPDADFDIRAIFHNVLNQQATPAQAADLVEQRLKQALPAALEAFQKKDPAAYQVRAKGSSQLLLVGMNPNSEVQVSRRSLPYQQDRPVQRDDSTGAPDHVGVAMIGDTTAIDIDLVRMQKTDAWQGMGNPADLEKLARRFIALEVVARPMQVGPPISMVLVDANGIHWVEPGACKQ
jgi:hypothetical protein